MSRDSAAMESVPIGADAWQLRTRRLDWPMRPLMMGIVNVTPDSFSDGGRFLDPDAAVAHGIDLVRQGANLLDIGGESTRPYSMPVDEAEELRRVVPVVRELARLVPVPLSIDTSKAAVAQAAIELGAEIINDVTALTGDPGMLDVARSTGAGLCVMHMLGTPRTMQENPTYQDVVREVMDYLRDRRDQLVASGIQRDRICLDPGLGFGKTTAHNFELLRSVWRIHELGQPLLVGHSRKGFLGRLVGNPAPDRSAVTTGVSLALACHGVQILRVHDVQSTLHAWTSFDAAMGGRWPYRGAAR